jgi:hypothetical protein
MIDHCFDEIESLHAWFGAWFRGEIEDNTFRRFTDSLAPSFVMFDPSGTVREREEVVATILGLRGARTVDIWVTDLHAVWAEKDLALVRYLEHQRSATGETVRRSTASFRRMDEAASGVQWLHVHETWLESSGP